MIKIHNNFSLKKYNTFGIDVNARYFAKPENIEELKYILSNSKYASLPVLILGGGSNVLFTKDFDGLVIQPLIKEIEIISENDQEILVRVGGGEEWDTFVEYTVSKGWWGLENLSDIPGKVGTCPIQNIGAYGVEVKDTIYKVEYLDLKKITTSTLSNEQCEFGYRESIFKKHLKNKVVIINVCFRLMKNPQPNLTYKPLKEAFPNKKSATIEEIRNKVIAIRKSKLPDTSENGNAGSFFKNPVVSIDLFKKIKKEHNDAPSYVIDENHIKIPAGWLIEKCGFKGIKKGETGVHKHQALVLINYGNATGSKILELAGEIRSEVHNSFGISLEYEVNIL